MTTSDMWCSGGRGILTELCLCTTIMVHCGTSSSYRLDEALILLGLAIF